MFKKFSIAVTAMLCMASASNAQQPCGTDEKYWQTVKQYPQILEYEQQFEEQVQMGINNGGFGNKTTISPNDTTIFDVPLVIHVVHDYGTEYLSDNAIYDAVKYWAVVYMGANSDTSYVINPFKKFIANSRIRLHLATIDPNGNPTKGVVHDRSYLTTNADDQAKYNQWPQNKYINLWFINTFGAASTGAAAYAYYPGSAAAMPYYDGVIGLFNYLNYDKAIPHELGHVLNLQHVWGNNNNAAVACGNDQVDDTPPTKGHNPVGCVPSALYDTTCATGYLKHYTSVLGVDSMVDYPDTVNAQNIMDYTYCQEMFTKGQAVRMRNALTAATAGRNNLITAANLAATGALAPMPDLPPVADFSMERATGAGVITDARTGFLTFNNAASFLFRNRSWNDTITGVTWTFSNGATVPTSTSVTTVGNNFTVPGWVTVSITATSNAGSTTLTDSKSVYVADTAVAGRFGYTQTFSDAASIANWPMFNYYDNQYKWSFYTGASWGGDNTCIKFRSFDTTQKRVATPKGDHDDFFTPAFDLTDINPTGNYYLNFYTAGARASSSGLGFGVTAYADSLEVDVSVTGGARWAKIAGYNGSQLSNNGTRSTEFVPTSAAQWVARGITIPVAYRTPNTFFRFRLWSGNVGNNLYLDDFSLSQFPAEVEAIANTECPYKIFPNPSSDGCYIAFKTGNEGKVTYSIKDMTGRVVYMSEQQYTPNSTAQETISRSTTPNAGIYFVTVTIDGNTRTEKMVVY